MIQWDKLSNHWPHTDKVYTVSEVSLSIPFRAICCKRTSEFSLGLFLQQESNFKGRVLYALHKFELDHALKNVILLNLFFLSLY